MDCLLNVRSENNWATGMAPLGVRTADVHPWARTRRPMALDSRPSGEAVAGSFPQGTFRLR